MPPNNDRLRIRAGRPLPDARQQPDAEFSAYPVPISGCDAQFNHLLAEHPQLARALSALAAEAVISMPRTPMPGTGIESR